MGKYSAAARVIADATGMGLKKAEQVAERAVYMAVDQPTRAANAATSNISQGAKYVSGGAVGVGGLHYGSKAYSDHARLQQERQIADVQQAIAEAADTISQQDDLSPDEREALIRAMEDSVGQAREGSAQNWGGDSLFNTGLPVELPGVGQISYGTAIFILLLTYLIVKNVDFGGYR